MVASAFEFGRQPLQHPPYFSLSLPIYIYIYIYICISFYLSLSRSIYLCIYLSISLSRYLFMYLLFLSLPPLVRLQSPVCEIDWG
jgi:hypothetical protein